MAERKQRDPRRASLTLDEDARNMLARTGNQSAYLSALIRQRWTEWQAALAGLRTDGWALADIGIACEKLNGVYGLAPEARLEQFQRSTGLDLGAEEAADLAVLAAEWWAGNKELRTQITADAPAKRARKR